MKNKLILTICILAIIMFAFNFIKTNETEIKANEYMNYLNNNKIKGGCFYIKNDTINTLKNY
jgi:hypothetical protein